MRKKLIIQILSKSGLFPKKHDALKALSNKRVKYGDRIVRQANFQVDIDSKDVFVDGKKVELIQEKYYVLNKPEGYSCQKNEGKNIFSLFSKEDKKIQNSLFSVGRLDVPTTGLLIVTNDGDFALKILEPKHKMGKKYLALLDDELDEGKIKKLENGIEIEVQNKKYITKPAKITKNDKKEIIIEIYEGKKRQVRKMFAAVGRKVLQLKRIAISRLTLGDIREGEYKEYSKKDIAEKIF